MFIFVYATIFPILVILLYDHFAISGQMGYIETITRKFDSSGNKIRELQEKITREREKNDNIEKICAALWADVNGYDVIDESITITTGKLREKWGLHPRWKVEIDNILGEFDHIKKY